MPVPNIHSDDIEKTYYKIGEVAAFLNVNVSLIRFWEKEFPQVKPNKTAKGDRKYTTSEIQLLQQIYQLVKVEGYTLQGAKDKLNLTPKDNQQIIQKLFTLKQYLIELKSSL
jgi:DNA-binding transcriptional MerR regulator